MPRIPMSDRGFVPHVENNVRMHGAPGMDFGMENVRALRGAARGLNDFADDVLSLGAAARDYVERQADTQNKLAATNARNLYRAYNEELENRMAANPADFKEFSKWADETDQRYLDDVRQYTEQMTTDFRNQFNAEMEGIRIDSLGRRSRIGIQAKITADYNMMQTLFKDAAERGDEAECKRILDEHRGTLISEEEYQQRMVDYGRIADSAAAKREVDACSTLPDGTEVPAEQSVGRSAAVLKKLQERDSDGNFINYKGITEDYRDQLIRVANTQKNKAELESRQVFLAEVNHGNVPTEEELKAKHESGELTDEQFNWQLNTVEQYNAKKENEETRKRNRKLKEEAEAYQADANAGKEVEYDTPEKLSAAYRDKKIDAEQYNNLLAILERNNAKKENEETRSKRQIAEDYAARLAAGDEVKWRTFGELKAARERGDIDDSLFNTLSGILSKHEQAIESAKEKRNKDIVNSFKWDIFRAPFTANPEQAYGAANRFLNIIDGLDLNPEQRQVLTDFLMKKVTDTLSHKVDEFRTPDGEHVLDFIYSKFWDKDASSYQGLVYDKRWYWRDGDNSQEHQRAQFYNILEMARERLRAGRPSEDIEKDIMEKVGQMNRGEIRTVLDMMNNPRATEHTAEMWKHVAMPFLP